MTIVTETRTVKIALRYWRGGWDAGYDPDCFSDLEVNFPLTHDMLPGSSDYTATDAEVDELITWWRQECANANAGYDHERYSNDEDYLQYGPEGEVLAALTDEQRARGDEWILIID